MQAPTRFKRIAGIGLLAFAIALSVFTGLGGQHHNSQSTLGVPAAYAEGGGPPDLTRPGGDPGSNPTPTPTPTPAP
jgi:hypothetical protein